MNALLIIAHGSRRTQSNEEIRQLTATVAEHSHNKFDLVDCAFLELCEPYIPDGIANLAEKGAKHIKVLPYFLAKGTHVADDVPAEVEKAIQSNPDLSVEILPYLGTSSELPALLLSIAAD